MRRTVLLLAVMAVAIVVASGVALANNIEGNGGNNRLVGTNGDDTISGGGGNDDIFGKGGQDRLNGDSGNDDVYGGGKGDRLQSGQGQDELFGQEGSDFANAIDGQGNDRVNCGKGNDLAGIDTMFGDQVSANCESVYIGIGPLPNEPLGAEAGSGSGTVLSAIDTLEEAEAAEAKGLLRQIR